MARVVPHLRSLDGKLAAALGVAVALLLVPVAPSGVPILAASAAVLLGLRQGPAGRADQTIDPVGDPA